MACKRATPVVWMMVVAVAAIVVAENGRMCLAFDMGEAKDSVMNKAEEAKETAGSWTNWAYNKISGNGKISVNPQDMKKSVEDMMKRTTDTASDATNYVSGKVHVVSHAAKDSSDKFYVEAKRDVGAAYDSMATKTVRED